jgi:hypothetical protein
MRDEFAVKSTGHAVFSFYVHFGPSISRFFNYRGDKK